MTPSRLRHGRHFHSSFSDDLDDFPYGDDHNPHVAQERPRPVIHVSITVVTEDSRIEISEDSQHAGLVTVDAREQAVLALMAATAKVLRYYGHDNAPSEADCADAAERRDNTLAIELVSIGPV